MPAKSSRHTITRQWALLKLLPTTGPGSTSKELCESLSRQGYKVSKRQTERDLGDLMEVFPIDCNNISTPFGWRWVKGAQVDIPGISMPEALSLKLMEGSISPLLPTAIMKSLEPRIKQAEKLLNTQLTSNLEAKWVKKIRTVSPTLPLCPPDIDENILEKIQHALLNEQQIKAQYQPNSTEDFLPYLINPLALVQRGPITYLVGTVNNFNDKLLFALHRFSKVIETNKPINIPPSFDLDKYIEDGNLNFGSKKQICLKAKLSKHLSKILRETPLSKNQKITINVDRDSIEVTLPDTWQLRWWILSQGDGIEVISPEELREVIGKKLLSASKIYSEI